MYFLYIIFLLIGTFSLAMIGITYIYIVYKHKKIDAIFFFEEYASKKEGLVLKLGGLGFLATILFFIFF